MAAPTFVAASTGAADTAGAWTHTSAAPGAAGRILIVQVVQDGTTTGANHPTITSVTNAENLAGTDNVLTTLASAQPIGSATSAYQHLWIGRSLSTSAMVITGANVGGDDVFVRVYEFANVNTGTTLADVIENSTAGTTANGAGTSTTCSDTGVTTLGVDRLALNFVGLADDAMGLAAFAGETGGDWTLATAIYEDATGTDATLGLMTSLVTGIEQRSSGSSLDIGSAAALTYLAQSFDATGTGGLSFVDVQLGVNFGSPTDDLTIAIRADSSGSPSSSNLVSATLTNAQLTASAWNRFTFSSPVSLTNGTKYWIVAYRSGAVSGANYRTWSRASSDVYASNSAKWSTDGSTWPSSSAQDQTFALGFQGTINGGSDAITSIGWGVIGLALLPVVTVPATSLMLPNRNRILTRR